MTARVDAGDGRLRIHRTGVARWIGSSLDVPLAHVVSVGAADPHEVMGWNKGIRLAGIQIPGLRASGIFQNGEQLTWWDVGRSGRAVVITLRDERLTRGVVEVDDPAAVIEELEQVLANATPPAEPTVG
jgi:hypothetical protein